MCFGYSWKRNLVKQRRGRTLQVFAERRCEIVDVDVPELSYAAMTSMLTSSDESAGIIAAGFANGTKITCRSQRGIAVGMTITPLNISPPTRAAIGS